jgi:hypothetical protein
MKRTWPTVLAWSALLTFAAAAAGFGMALDGFSHRVHPLAVLGARGVPNGAAYSVVGLLLPGVLAAFATAGVAARWEHAGWIGRVGRIGMTMCMLSAIAFAAQGVFRIDIDDARMVDWGARLHASAWSTWWIAFVAGAVALVVGWRGVVGMRREVVMRVATSVAAVLVLAFALVVAVPETPALGQRIACGAWFAWLVLAASLRTPGRGRGASASR